MSYGMLKGSATNKKVKNLCAQVWHCGKNDYRVVIVGIGEYSTHHQMSPAFVKARWLAGLEQADLNHEIAKVQNQNNTKAGASA